MTRPLLLAGVAALLGFLVAGCGGSNGPGVANIAATTTAPASGSASVRPSASAFASCLVSHGFQAAVGSSGAGRSLSIFGVTVTGNVDPSSPQFQSALQACRKDLPGGGPPQLTPAQQAEHAKAMARFAGCMRSHGVPDFPDPDAQGMFTPGQLEKLDPASSFFQSAFKSCGSLQSKVGPRLAFGERDVSPTR